MLLGADAVGKHLLIRFDDGRTLHAHLLMTGSWRVGPAATEPEWRRRVELWLDDGRLTGLDVPLLSMIATADEADVRRPPRPGPVRAGATRPRPGRRPTSCGRRTSRSAAALLDQRNVAGWGNLYANELPFIVGVSPFQPVGAIAGLDGLVAIGAALIRTNAARGPQNTTGRKLATDDHWIYKRRNQPCPLCATRLRRRDERDVPVAAGHHVVPGVSAARVPSVTVDLPRARRLLALHPARREPAFPLSAR